MYNGLQKNIIISYFNDKPKLIWLLRILIKDTTMIKFQNFYKIHGAEDKSEDLKLPKFNKNILIKLRLIKVYFLKRYFFLLVKLISVKRHYKHK